VVDKVFIQQEEHPDINFVGLLIGPRGNTLKMLEKDTNAKIIIRGKGSIKENKIGRSAGQPLPGEDEPLHAYITGATPEVVALACEKIREIIKQGIEVPETMNDLRRQQLRELALINGTLRENDSLNKLKLLQTAQTIVTNTIICGLCGSAGHITSDCKLRNSSEPEGAAEKQPTWAEREKMDTEYLSLMAELGQGQAPDTSKSAGKCIINRNGSSAGPLLSIESNGTAIESGNAKTESTEKTEYETNTNQAATSSSDETIDGKKVIDMTQLARNPSQPNGSVIVPRAPAFLMGHKPSYLGEEDTNTSNIASAAMLYSQQMNYYAQMGVPPYPGMPMWPGAPMPQAPYGWPPMGMAPPPPPPPPPSS
jgi:splicing factor 1